MIPETPPHQCGSCDRSFTTAIGLELHGVRIHRRRVIRKASDTSAEQTESEDEPGGRQDLVTCPECEGLYRTEEALAGHVEQAHVEPASPSRRPPTEDEVVREVADRLPNSYSVGMFQSDRLARVRGSSRIRPVQLGRHPARDDDRVTRMFWGKSDREVLEALRARGVRFRVEEEGNGR